MRSSAPLLVFLWLGAVAAPAAEPPTAAIWTNNVDRSQCLLARDLAADLQAAGYRVAFLDNAALADPHRLSADQFDLLVLPDAQSLPVDAVTPLQHFLQAGRDLIALGLPAWQHPLFRHGDRWLAQADFDRALAPVKPDHSLTAFTPADVARWTRTSNTPEFGSSRSSQPAGTSASLHVVIDNLAGWDTLVSPPLDHPFPAGHTLTCFRAKGDAHTAQLAVEWRETDGSRWIAAVDLAPDWKSYVLAPDQFRAWEPPPGRGGRRDHLRVENADRFTVGLAFSHTAVGPGRHEYWLANLGTARSPYGDVAPPATSNLPQLETLSPSYQCYALQESALTLALSPGEREPPAGLFEHSKASVAIAARRDSPPKDQNGTDDGGRSSLSHPMGEGRGEGHSPFSAPNPAQGRTATLDKSGTATAPFEWIGVTNALQPRPRGVGFDQRRPWRWQPLLQARTANGDYRGAIATLLVHVEPRYRGGAWASFTPSDPAFYRQPAIQQLLRELAGRLRRGLFLIEGGSEFFTVFEDQPVRLGARVANFGQERRANLTVRLTDSDAATRQVAFTQAWQLSLASGAEQTVEHTWRPARWPPGGYQVTTELRFGNRIIDRLQHEL
ncbi:MAG: hypothetical protein KGS61_21155, partial [Verrucomicrobia bacterium]|nr:hypothetical protein [Verrucomicrobiota bacterium]